MTGLPGEAANVNKSSFMMAFFIYRAEINMKNDIYSFYESKFRIFCVLLGCILFLFGSYWLSQSVVSKEKIVGCLGLIFFGLCLIVAIFKITSNKTFIEVTPTYIKMYNFEKLLWTDITDVQNVQIHSARFFYFNVRCFKV